MSIELNIAKSGARTLNSTLRGRPGAQGKRRASGDGVVAILLFSIVNLAVLALGWIYRDTPLLAPKFGARYLIGIAGALLMLALILYPMRKRMRLMRSWGNPANWFRWHMMLGIVGPVLVVVHSGFKLNSANAAVALLAMLVVAGSGVAGRYLYGRVHRGLYGQKLEARSLREEAVGARQSISLSATGDRAWASALQAFEKKTLADTPTLSSALARALTVGGHIRKCRKLIRQAIHAELDREARAQGWSKDDIQSHRRAEDLALKTYFSSISRAATLGVYERLFSLWHVLHVPLFVILVITALVHVVAVHLY